MTRPLGLNLDERWLASWIRRVALNATSIEKIDNEVIPAWFRSALGAFLVASSENRRQDARPWLLAAAGGVWALSRLLPTRLIEALEKRLECSIPDVLPENLGGEEN